jgi:hypothetical protein
LDVIGGAGVSPESREDLAPVAIGLTDAPFLSLEYDPVNKGNAITISSGVDEVAYEHPVEGPAELTANLDRTDVWTRWRFWIRTAHAPS